MQSFAFLLILVLAGTAPIRAFAVGCSTSVLFSKTAVGLVGCISKEASEQVINGLTNETRTLVIQSEGGDVNAAMALAYELARRKIVVRVRGFCHSACVNYILPAAMHASVEEGGVLMLHGDARTAILNYGDKDYLDPALLSLLIKISADEEREFSVRFPRAEQTHLLQRLLFLRSNDKSAIVLDGVRYLCNGMNKKYWTATAADLLQFGLIDDISARDDSLFPTVASAAQAMQNEVAFSKIDIVRGCNRQSGL
ncbi:hypothetical protein [Paucibacter soli]|uniref:hypothetical protein n=1 Tax=Paucibacter soli TaxID=3133433 RepID=UPI0030B69912